MRSPLGHSFDSASVPHTHSPGLGSILNRVLPLQTAEWAAWFAGRLAVKAGWVLIACVGAAATEDCHVPTYPQKTPFPAWLLAAQSSPRKRAVLVIRGTYNETDALLDGQFEPATWEATQDGVGGLGTRCESPLTSMAFARSLCSPPSASRPPVSPATQPPCSRLLTSRVRSASRFPGRALRFASHGGFLRAARAILDDCGCRAALEKLRVAGYELTVVGHSLGGGVASIITALLRFGEVAKASDPSLPPPPPPPPRYDAATCVSFASPACVDTALSDALRGIVLTVTHNDDVVPRLNDANCRQLARDLIADDALYKEVRAPPGRPHAAAQSLCASRLDPLSREHVLPCPRPRPS